MKDGNEGRAEDIREGLSLTLEGGQGGGFFSAVDVVSLREMERRSE